MDPRPHTVSLRLTDEEMTLVERVATHSGETLGSVFRRLTIPQVRRLARKVERENSQLEGAGA